MKEVGTRLTIRLTEEGTEKPALAGEHLLLAWAGSEPRPLGPGGWVLNPHATLPLASSLGTAVHGIKWC